MPQPLAASPDQSPWPALQRPRGQRVAGRGDVRPVPTRPPERRPGLGRVLRQASLGNGSHAAPAAPKPASTPPRPPPTARPVDHREGTGGEAQPRPAQVQAKPAETKRRGRAPRPKPAPVAKPRPDAKAAEPAKGTTSPVPKESKPAEPTPAKDEATYTILRGAPARTAQNMDASLTVPTATSVRSVPVKLLWDNRIVINNHLSRARGGKVSFTHLIGYALVKALKAMPEMNVGFDTIDGKPNLITPAHINLGLAIDVQKADGTRQLAGAQHQGRREHGLRGVLDGVRGHRRRSPRQQAHHRGLPGHHDLADQPRHHRHQPLGAAPDEGQGAIIGVGAMEYPPEYAGRLRRDDRAQRHQQGHDAHLDLRPPGHPGRQSGDFLRRMHHLLLGEEEFYDEIFAALRIPYEPIRWSKDIASPTTTRSASRPASSS